MAVPKRRDVAQQHPLARAQWKAPGAGHLRATRLPREAPGAHVACPACGQYGPARPGDRSLDVLSRRERAADGAGLRLPAAAAADRARRERRSRAARARPDPPLLRLREAAGCPPTSAWSSSATRCSAWWSPTPVPRPTPTCPRASWPSCAPPWSTRAPWPTSRATLDLGESSGSAAARRATGGRDKSSILADTLEAVIGAVYLDHGLEAAARFVHRLFDPLMADVPPRGAPAWTGRPACRRSPSLARLGVPDYEVIEYRAGPREAVHRRSSGSATSATARAAGRNKKEAEQEAAATAFAAPAGPQRHRTPRADARAGLTMPELPEVEAVRRGLAAGITGRRSAAVEVLHPRPCAGTCRAAPTSPHRLVGRTSPNRGGGASTSGCRWPTADAVLAHLGMSGQFRLEPAAPRWRPTPGCVFTSPTATRSCGSSTSACSAACPLVDRWGGAAGRGRPHRPRPLRPRLRPRGSVAAAARPSAPGSSGRCWTRRWSAASATSTPTRRSGRPGCTMPGPPDSVPGPGH